MPRQYTFAQWQKEILPYHVCRTDFPGYDDDHVFPQPPLRCGRVLCPNRDCRMHLWVPEKSPWVEYPKMKRGDHPLDREPPAGYGEVIRGTGWWRKRCENCGSQGHTIAMCGQYNVQKLCSFCNMFGHEAYQCQKALNNQRSHGILPYARGTPILMTRRVVPPRRPETEASTEVENLIDLADPANTLMERQARDNFEVLTEDHPENPAIRERETGRSSNFDYGTLSFLDGPSTSRQADIRDQQNAQKTAKVNNAPAAPATLTLAQLNEALDQITGLITAMKLQVSSQTEQTANQTAPVQVQDQPLEQNTSVNTAIEKAEPQKPTSPVTIRDGQLTLVDLTKNTGGTV